MGSGRRSPKLVNAPAATIARSAANQLVARRRDRHAVGSRDHRHHPNVDEPGAVAFGHDVLGAEEPTWIDIATRRALVEQRQVGRHLEKREPLPPRVVRCRPDSEIATRRVDPRRPRAEPLDARTREQRKAADRVMERDARSRLEIGERIDRPSGDPRPRRIGAVGAHEPPLVVVAAEHPRVPRVVTWLRRADHHHVVAHPGEPATGRAADQPVADDDNTLDHGRAQADSSAASSSVGVSFGLIFGQARSILPSAPTRNAERCTPMYVLP